ncbi:MAG: EF-Tu/IF-2/RF-3 family GTPase, partial [Clostridiales bacterium]
GTATLDFDEEGTDLTPLFDKILEYIDPPDCDPEGPLEVLVSSIEYSEYVGRIAVGRIERGTMRQNQEIAVCDYHNKDLKAKAKITAIYQIDGLDKTPVTSARAGDIVSFSGIEGINIGNTVCDPSCVEALPFVKISEPTVEMTFSVNDGPFAGQEGKYVTSRQIRERLFRELLKDVSLHVKETDTADSFVVMGRGEMHLSILIETMRREGYEFQVSTPKVLFKEENGKKMEPYEKLVIDVPEESMGTVMESMGIRKGELQSMMPVGSRVKMEFIIPSRGLFGYRGEFLTNTRGEGILNAVFHEYGPYKGEIAHRTNGSLVAFETGDSVAYGLYNAQDRGSLFIGAGERVYGGMVVGFSPKS